MAQSLAKVLVHLIFSTKERRCLIAEDIREELNAYLVGVLRNHDSPALAVNGVTDHMHILFRLSRNYAVSTIVEEVKKASSKWIKTKGPLYTRFHWQDGYAAFSIGKSGEQDARRYIASQNEHHRQTSFQDELRAFLQKYDVGYDERYVWG